MFTTPDTTLREAVRRRTKAVLEALADQGISEADVHTEFIASFRDRATADDAWLRLKHLENPTAAELCRYAAALQVNTTWLITGDVRFINDELLSGTCLCWLLPENELFVHYGATEPGSTHEYSPDCLVHGGAASHQMARRNVLMELLMSRGIPKPAIDLAPVFISNPDYSETEV